jgi:hypothetical protein
MTATEFRVESNHPISGWRVSDPGFQQSSFGDRAVAVAMAAKSVTKRSGQEIRVIHVPTGEVVFRKSGSTRPEFSDEF